MDKERTPEMEKAMGRIEGGIQDGMKDGGVSVFVGRERQEYANKFAIVFFESLEWLVDEFELSRIEMRVLLRILSHMAYGNLVILSQSDIMREIGCSPTNSTKVFRKLRDCKILIKVNGHTYLNPHIIAMGRFRKNDPDAMRLIENAADELAEIGMEPNILNKAIKQRQKAKKKESA